MKPIIPKICYAIDPDKIQLGDRVRWNNSAQTDLFKDIYGDEVFAVIGIKRVTLSECFNTPDRTEIVLGKVVQDVSPLIFDPGFNHGWVEINKQSVGNFLNPLALDLKFFEKVE